MKANYMTAIKWERSPLNIVNRTGASERMEMSEDKPYSQKHVRVGAFIYLKRLKTS